MLQKILQNKEQRAQRQKDALSSYKNPIISITVNIPGEKKLSHETIFIYHEMVKKLKTKLHDKEYKEVFKCEKETGIEGIISVKMKADKLKLLTCKLEDEEFLGRFIDFDVIDEDNKLLSRKDFSLPQRKCFICDEVAVFCARSRKHSVVEMVEYINSHVKLYKLIQKIALMAKEGMRVEVDLTPKPGLVDRFDSGSHKDMDRDTFYKSIEAISPFLEKFIIVGFKTSEDKLFDKLRVLGQSCEKKMFEATNGVNTHKGMIFSLAVILGTVGMILQKNETLDVKNLQVNIKSICKDLVQKDLASKKSFTSAGERYFKLSKNAGIRLEAQNGYLNIFLMSLPYYEKMQNSFSEDKALKMTLLKLMSEIEDTTLFNRGGKEAMEFVKSQSKKALLSNDIEKELIELNKSFIEKNLSPGGSADMLALTWIIQKVLVKL